MCVKIVEFASVSTIGSLYFGIVPRVKDFYCCFSFYRRSKCFTICFIRSFLIVILYVSYIFGEFCCCLFLFFYLLKYCWKWH